MPYHEGGNSPIEPCPPDLTLLENLLKEVMDMRAELEGVVEIMPAWNPDLAFRYAKMFAQAELGITTFSTRIALLSGNVEESQKRLIQAEQIESILDSARDNNTEPLKGFIESKAQTHLELSREVTDRTTANRHKQLGDNYSQLSLAIPLQNPK